MANSTSPRRMLVGTFHKTGTILMRSIMRDVAKEIGLRFCLCTPTTGPDVADVFFQSHSKFSEELLTGPFRGVIVIRDPRDVIISGALYHSRQDSKYDQWLYRPEDRLGGRSYYECISALETNAEKFLFEMNNMGKRTLLNMKTRAGPSPAFMIVRFEDLVADVDLNEFRRIFLWLGVTAQELPQALEIAHKSSLFSGMVTSQHVRSGKPAQWREHFTPELHQEFCKRFGNLAEQLGYPAP